MNTWKKKGAGLLALVMLMGCLVGCSFNSTNKVQTVGEEKKEQVTLTFLETKQMKAMSMSLKALAKLL